MPRGFVLSRPQKWAGVKQKFLAWPPRQIDLADLPKARAHISNIGRRQEIKKLIDFNVL
jgi:hypothetical protein